MAGFAAVADQPCPVRSISLPSRSNTVAARVDEELCKVKACVASLSAMPSAKAICNALRELGILYSSIDELLHLPSNQQALLHPQEKWVEEELNCSIRLLDLRSAMMDNLAAAKEHVQELQLALRRKGDIISKTKSCMRLAKKAKKDIKECNQGTSSKLDAKLESRSDIQKVVMTMIEAREITVSLLGSIAAFMSPKPKHKAGRWSFVSKTMSMRRVPCKGEHQDEEDFSLCSICESISCKDIDSLKVTKAQDQLAKLNGCFEGLEIGLESIYRQIIQNRVTLLNLLSL